jgi:uncharacterized HAD superfamily protein
MMTTGQPRIYVDFDDVLCETASALAGLLERRFGRKIRVDDISSFNLGESFSLTPEELDHFFELAHQPEELLQYQPMPGVRAALQNWLDAGYAVDIVTGRPPSSDGTSREWLRQHDIPHSGLVFVDKYGRYGAAKDVIGVSLAEFRQLRYCLAIDDSPTMVRFLAEEMRLPVVIMDRPWNRAVAVDPGLLVCRCADWREIASRFLKP